MTLYKIVLFMARCLDHRIGTALRNLFPQPQLFPLPVVDDYSIPLGSNEGARITVCGMRRLMDDVARRHGGVARARQVLA